MHIRSYRYSEHLNTPQAWEVRPFGVDAVNLFVGPNASGKTRILNTIAVLAALLSKSPQLQISAAEWQFSLSDGINLIDVELFIKDSKVAYERLLFNGDQKLIRFADGSGSIWFDQVRQMVPFKSTDTSISMVAKRDSLQHPFLDPLFDWSSKVRHFQFSSDLGRAVVHLLQTNKDPSSVDLEADTAAVADPNATVEQYQRGWQQLGVAFDLAILEDLRRIGYDCDSVDAVHAEDFPFIGGRLPIMLQVKERDIAVPTKQFAMSNGMFRALAIIIHINFALMTALDTSIIIDDIGEGLDFGRSTSLIGLLIEKCNDTRVQLLMSSNDRFVMNEVPLRYWHILNRVGQRIDIIDRDNSGALFDEFKFLGLSNFDFFSNRAYMGSKSH